MCGIIGYIGEKEAFPILLEGLKKIEYRGYDSSGVALLNGKLDIYKKKDIFKDHLEQYLKATRQEKKAILNHVCFVTSLHRKSAIRRFRRLQKEIQRNSKIILIFGLRSPLANNIY